MTYEKFHWRPGGDPFDALRVGDTIMVGGRIAVIVALEPTGRDDLDRSTGTVTVRRDDG